MRNNGAQYAPFENQPLEYPFLEKQAKNRPFQKAFRIDFGIGKN